MTLRDELFEQSQGLGVLELRGGDLELALFVNGQPFVYDAADCTGSVLRFTTLLPDPPDTACIHDLEHNAQKGFDEGVPLHKQIMPFLSLLPNGLYRLALVNTSDCATLDWNGDEKSGQAVGYYPLGDHYERIKWLVPTQNVLQDERINFYLGEIERGAHPALVIVGSNNHDAWFVLDGHHKLMASWCCGVRLRALLIEFQSINPISSREANAILSQEFVDASSYLKWKAHRESLL